MDNNDELNRWNFVNDPVIIIQKMPALFVMECLMFLLTVITFVHANRSERRQKLIWGTTLALGAVNDQFFALLPQVDNFFHAQGTIMLTHRLPLHVVLQYNVFMYPAITAAYKVSCGSIRRAAVAALLGCVTQMLNDVISTKFILYTWHDSDAALKYRLMGVAIGNNSFLLCFVFSFVLLMELSEKLPTLVRSISLLCLSLTSPCAIMLTVLSQLIYQSKEGAIPTYFSYCVILILLFCFAFLPLMKNSKKEDHVEVRELHNDVLLFRALIIHAACVTLLMYFGAPQNQVSIGYHQLFLPSRHQLCNDQATPDSQVGSGTVYSSCARIEQDFDFHCTTVPQNITKWYTLCGKTHSNWKLYMIFMFDLSLVQLIAYYVVLSKTKVRRKKSSQS